MTAKVFCHSNGFEDHPEDFGRSSERPECRDRLQRQEPDPPGGDAETVDHEERHQAHPQPQQDHRNTGGPGKNNIQIYLFHH